MSSTSNATVVGISATTSLQTQSTDNLTTIDGDSNVDDVEVPCHVCGMIPAPVIPEAKQLLKPMQAAFQISPACVENKAKVFHPFCTFTIFYIII